MTARGLKLSSFLELCKKTKEDVLVNMLYCDSGSSYNLPIPGGGGSGGKARGEFWA